LDVRIEEVSVTAGTRLRPYEIVSLIGQGGMGEVSYFYAARCAVGGHLAGTSARSKKPNITIQHQHPPRNAFAWSNRLIRNVGRLFL
jgi:hypothetical protein